MTPRAQAVVYATLIPATLATGFVLAIIGDRVRVWRNARRWTR